MDVSMKVTKIDLAPLASNGERARLRARRMVTLAVRDDTRPYVPFLTGALMRSGDTGTDADAGRIVYGSSAVPYARAQYYGLPNKTRNRHPLACMEWFEASKAVNARKWEKVAGNAVALSLAVSGGDL